MSLCELHDGFTRFSTVLMGSRMYDDCVQIFCGMLRDLLVGFQVYRAFLLHAEYEMVLQAFQKCTPAFFMGGANEFAGRRSLEKRRCGADDFQAGGTAQQEV